MKYDVKIWSGRAELGDGGKSIRISTELPDCGGKPVLITSNGEEQRFTLPTNLDSTDRALLSMLSRNPRCSPEGREAIDLFLSYDSIVRSS